MNELSQLPSDDDILALRTTHPLTVAAFESMDALAALRAVRLLDQRWTEIVVGRAPTTAHTTIDTLPEGEGPWDLIYAGGGLALLHALVMRQRYGCRVLIFDRDRVGRAHREWNISDAELHALVELGVFSDDELEAIIAHRHERGVVRFHSQTISVPASELWMTGVLDVSLDAAELLRRVRARLERAGGEIRDGYSFRSVQAASEGVAVEVADAQGQTRVLRGRLLIDGMGASSPLSLQRYRGHPFEGICPTVGTTVRGLQRGDRPDQHNPAIGDILISVADEQNGKQLIWEGFAGRDDELTIYLFFYDQVARPAVRHSLLDLFEEYFALLPTYKRPGPDFRHLKPVYGYIPSRHAQRRSTAPPLQGVLPIGDAAARQSPLTFTGFGSHVRNLERATSLLDYALRHNLLAPRWLDQISAYQANVALHWVFSRFMQPWGRPNDVNQLQNVFARVLNELGDNIAERFFKDQMLWSDYGRIVNHTLTVHRPIIPTAFAVLGPLGVVRWIVDYGRFSRAALFAFIGARLSSAQWWAAERIAERLHPGLRLMLRSRRAEWRVMGWVK